MSQGKQPTQSDILIQQLGQEEAIISIDSQKLIEENVNYTSIADHYRKNKLKNAEIEKIVRKNYKNIVVLNLCGNEIDAIPKNFANSLPNLQNLNLSRNLFVNFPKEVRNISLLKTLDLSRNGIKDIKNMKGSLRTCLQTLNLSGNRFEHFPAALTECETLTSLDISRNALQNDTTRKGFFSFRSQPPIFPKLNNKSPIIHSLTSLSISDCNLNSLPIPNFLIHLKNLKTLDASKNNLKNISYVEKKIFYSEDVGTEKKKSTEEQLLPNLQELNLSYCKLTSISPKFLTSSSHLIHLRLDHNELTSFILVPSIPLGSNVKSPTFPISTTLLVIDKSERLSNLTSLDLSRNKIDNLSDNIFKQLNKLLFFSLSYQETSYDYNTFFHRVTFEDLTDVSVIGLAGLHLRTVPQGLNRRIEIINLSHNKLSQIPQEIYDMKNLKTLKLADNNISELDFGRMTQLQSLRTIRLQQNSLISFPRIFLKLKQLQEVNLDHNLHELQFDQEVEDWKEDNGIKLSRAFASPNKIDDGLYLGNAQTAQNPHHLKHLGVTHILTVASGLPPPFPTKFTYKIIEIEDTNNDVLKKYFVECIQFIEDALNSRGSVLVHCRAGVSRSATIVISYIIKSKKLNVNDALEYVKNRRNQICPNPSFMKQLEQYAKEIKVPKL